LARQRDRAGAKQWRNIVDHEVREVLKSDENGVRVFAVAGPVQITASGRILDGKSQTWTRQKRARRSKTVDLPNMGAWGDISEIVVKRDKQAMPCHC
jgi:hypothetical protein